MGQSAEDFALARRWGSHPIPQGTHVKRLTGHTHKGTPVNEERGLFFVWLLVVLFLLCRVFLFLLCVCVTRHSCE